jgi:hypothetical protein
MPSEPVTLPSLFTGVKPPALTHDHPGFTGADVRDIQASLLAKGLPLEIARVILDKALVWTRLPPVQPHRAHRPRHLGGARDPRPGEQLYRPGGRISHELPRLKGNVFYLVSAPLRCDGSSGEEQKGKEAARGTKEKAVPDWATIAKVSDKDLKSRFDRSSGCKGKHGRYQASLLAACGHHLDAVQGPRLGERASLLR